MLAPTVNGRFCAWLRSRRARKGAALLTRLALRGLQGVSGRGASRHIDAKASNKGLGVQEASAVGNKQCADLGKSDRRQAPSGGSPLASGGR